MNVFCVDDLSDCDLVPCVGCGKLYHCLVLDRDFRCESCAEDSGAQS